MCLNKYLKIYIKLINDVFLIDTEKLLYIYFAYDVPNTFQSNFLRKSHSKNKEKEENESVTANPRARGRIISIVTPIW